MKTPTFLWLLTLYALLVAAVAVLAVVNRWIAPQVGIVIAALFTFSAFVSVPLRRIHR